MKKLSLLFYLIVFGYQAKAQCQLCALSEENVKKVVNFLKMETELVVYANDCNAPVKDVARHIKIKKVSYRPADRKDYFEIVLEGTMIGTFDIENQTVANYAPNDAPFHQVIDIAYIHIRTGGYTNQLSGKNTWDATCLGIYLGFDCDPCIDPFDYPVAKEDE